MAKKAKVNLLVEALRELPYLSDREALERLGDVIIGTDLPTALLDDLHAFEKAAGNLLLAIDVDKLNRRFG